MLRPLLAITTVAGILAGVFMPAPAGAVTGLPAGFGTSMELTGLTRPTRIAWAPDGRRFVTEKDGVLKVVPAGSNTAQTVLDIRSEVNTFQDRGLLGLAVDSDFASNGYVYLLYTYDLNRATTNPGPDAQAPAVSQLRRIKLNAASQILASQVILGTRTTGICPTPNNDVDCIPSDSVTHSIGTVISAPDGTLFVGSGDGADYNIADPLSLRTYDERSMAGKIVHVDRDGRGLPSHPFCPAETTLTKVCTKLYAKGFRNPFRFQLLPSGALLVGDVGWATYEEVDYVGAGGKSYGWPCYEGPIHTPTWKDKAECQPEYAKEGTANAHVPPIHSYQHDYALKPSWAVVAGPEYTGDSYPAGYRGSIFWGDFGAGFIRRIQLTPSGQLGSVTGDFATNWNESVDLTSAPNGDIVWLDLNGWGDTGFAERLRYTPGNAAPNAVAGASPRNGTAPLPVNFDGSGSSDPDGDTLSYDWDFGDGTAHGTGAKPSHTFTNSGTYTVTLTVSDGRGRSDTDTVQINASNTPPVPSIDAPPAGSLYRDGTALTVTGSATDAEQGTLPASAFSWNVVLQHKDHEHLLISPTGVKTFQMTPVRDHDSDSHYRIRLTVTDSGGASVSTEREIQPETVPFHLRSTPAGAPLSLAGLAVTAPWDENAGIGFRATVTAGQTFTAGGIERNFLSWSDGGARAHDIEIPASETTLTAVYNAAPAAAASATPTSGSAPLAVSFDGSGSSDPDGDPLTYDWDFGDGSPAAGDVAVTHAFAELGDHAVTLRVSDPAGASSSQTVHVTVQSAPGPPSDQPPSGDQPPGGGNPPEPEDVDGPLFAPNRVPTRPRRLTGVVRDESGIDSVELAVARIGDGRCRWVSGAPPRLRRDGKCAPRRWLAATVKGKRWQLELPPSLPAGRYRAWLLAVDSHGNVGRLTTDGRGQLRFTVPAAPATARACRAALLRRPLACSAFAR
jgi:PKD repeat protein